MKALILAVLALLLPPKASAASPNFKKVVIVVFENIAYADALRQPFFGMLAKKGALLSNFYAVAHPSQPNYIAMTAGATHGVTGDGNVNLDVRHIGDLLEEAGLKWKVYAQGYPGHCFLGRKSRKYFRKHVPFLSFSNVQQAPARCANIVEASAFEGDLKAGVLPEYSLYIPDNRSNGHDTGAKFADRWFSSTFGPLLDDPAFAKDVLLVATFDEDDHSDYNHIYTALYGASVAAGKVSKQRCTHYSLLRTIEDVFKIGTLGLNDTDAAAISGVWK